MLVPPRAPVKIYLHPVKQYINHAVTAFRLQKGISQKGLADILAVSKAFVSRVERASTPLCYNICHLNTLSFYLEVPLETFLPAAGMDPEARVLKTAPRLTDGPVNRVSRNTHAKKKRYGKYDSFRF